MSDFRGQRRCYWFCKDDCPEKHCVDKAVENTRVSRLVSVLLQISVDINTALINRGSAVEDAILIVRVTTSGGETDAAVTVAMINPNTSSLIMFVKLYTQTSSLSFFV